MTETDKLIAKFASDMTRDKYRRLCRDHRLTFNAAADSIDARLAEMASRFSHTGMAQSFGNWIDKGWYKAQAARKLLALRSLRRWHVAENGNAYTSRALLADAEHCRRRAAGIVAMPVVFVGGW